PVCANSAELCFRPIRIAGASYPLPGYAKREREVQLPSKPSTRDTGKRRSRMQGFPVATDGFTVIRSNCVRAALKSSERNSARPRPFLNHTPIKYFHPSQTPPLTPNPTLFHTRPAATLARQ